MTEWEYEESGELHEQRPIHEVKVIPKYGLLDCGLRDEFKVRSLLFDVIDWELYGSSYVYCIVDLCRILTIFLYLQKASCEHFECARFLGNPIILE